MQGLEVKSMSKEWRRRRKEVESDGRRKCWWAAGIWLLAFAITVAATPLDGEEASEIAEGTRALYQGDYAQARALALKYVAAHPELAPGRILLARAEIAQSQYEAAYQDLQRALDLDPTDIDALYYLERLCAILSQVEFRELIQTAPDSMRAHQLLAESYLAQHHDEEAEQEYEAALKSDPTSVEILDALGELERRAFKFDAALAYYQRAAKLAPRDYTSAYGIGACYLFKQDPQRAIESFRRALRTDAHSAATHLALGDALLREGQAFAAVTELKAAAKLVPDMRQAYTLLARAYEKLNQPLAAQEALEKERQLAQEEIKGRETTSDSGEPPPAGTPQ